MKELNDLGYYIQCGIKPDNIEIRPNFTVRLNNFKYMKQFRKGDSNILEKNFAKSYTYSSPELFNSPGTLFDPTKLAVWALGIVLMELVLERHPFVSKNMSAAHVELYMLKIQKEQEYWQNFIKSELKDKCDDYLTSAICSMCEVDYGKRWTVEKSVEYFGKYTKNKNPAGTINISNLLKTEKAKLLHDSWLREILSNYVKEKMKKEYYTEIEKHRSNICKEEIGKEKGEKENPKVMDKFSDKDLNYSAVSADLTKTESSEMDKKSYADLEKTMISCPKKVVPPSTATNSSEEQEDKREEETFKVFMNRSGCLETSTVAPEDMVNVHVSSPLQQNTVATVISLQNTAATVISLQNAAVEISSTLVAGQEQNQQR
jgi:serine/threonine protein kinase